MVLNAVRWPRRLVLLSFRLATSTTSTLFTGRLQPCVAYSAYIWWNYAVVWFIPVVWVVNIRNVCQPHKLNSSRVVVINILYLNIRSWHSIPPHWCSIWIYSKGPTFVFYLEGNHLSLAFEWRTLSHTKPREVWATKQSLLLPHFIHTAWKREPWGWQQDPSCYRVSKATTCLTYSLSFSFFKLLTAWIYRINHRVAFASLF